MLDQALLRVVDVGDQPIACLNAVIVRQLKTGSFLIGPSPNRGSR